MIRIAQLAASVIAVSVMATNIYNDIPKAPAPAPQAAPQQDVQTIIDRIAKLYGLSPAILRAVAYQESKFDVGVCSKAGACGVMQIMPATAKDLGVIDRANPIAAIDGAARHLKMLLGMFNGNLGLALAGYNGGQTRVKVWLKSGARPEGLKAETRDYVRSITGVDLQVWAGKVRTIRQLIAMTDETDHISRFSN